MPVAPAAPAALAPAPGAGGTPGAGGAERPWNCVALVGPTAGGKTALAVRLARALGGEIISADCRQVYRGLDIGSGKDLAEYGSGPERVPCHLINITTLEHEYSLYDFLRDAYRAFEDIRSRGRVPVLAGGTGMYADAFVRGYCLASAPENPALRERLAGKSLEELADILREARGGRLHNTTDTRERGQAVRAIEIAEALRTGAGERLPRPDIRARVLGLFPERAALRQRIASRLRARLDAGLVEETAALRAAGASWERLERLGLEYRFTARFLQGEIASRDALYETLRTAIGRFAKRQETWFRGMERKGVLIRRIPPEPEAARLDAALPLLRD